MVSMSLPQLWLKISLETINFAVCSVVSMSFPWFPYRHHVVPKVDTM